MQSSCTFPARFRQKYIELYAVCQNDWRETTGKMCINIAQQYLRIIDKANINEQNKLIATGPLYIQTEFETLLPKDVEVLTR